MINLVKKYALICAYYMYIGFCSLPKSFKGPFQPSKSDGSTKITAKFSYFFHNRISKDAVFLRYLVLYMQQRHQILNISYSVHPLAYL